MTTDTTEVNTLHPNLMKPQKRCSEIAAILAVGVLRLKQGQAAQKHSKKASNSLDLPVFPSVYGMDDAWLRGTVGYRKIDGKWQCVHEHSSFPVDCETMKADFAA